MGHKETGDRKSILLAIVQSVSETYENLKMLFEKTQVNDIKYQLSSDLKLLNIVTGISSASSRYPCCYAECSKRGRVWKEGKLRTLERNTVINKSWEDKTKREKSKLKDYMNCTEKPLLNYSTWGHTLVLLACPPPTLHLIKLGIMNSLIKCLKFNGGKEIFNEFGRKLHITPSCYHGDMYEGNEVSKIWRN